MNNPVTVRNLIVTVRSLVKSMSWYPSSLDWVGILTPDALDGFLVEKLEARRALVELDLEPSGLVIKHDDDGEVERVEPALGEKVRLTIAAVGI